MTTSQMKLGPRLRPPLTNSPRVWTESGQPRVVEMASRIAEAALASRSRCCGRRVVLRRLASEYLLLAELEIDGSIDASVYDLQDKLVQRMPKATAEAIISWIQK